MTRAVIYLRVSTAGQAADGYGLDAQAAACAVWADHASAEIVATERDEAVSGSLPAADRPGLVAALAALRDGLADTLVVARLDRLARDLTTQEAILAEVWRLGATVYAADYGEVRADDPDDPMRTAIRQVMGVFAQLDKAMIVKRLRDGRRAKKAQGLHGEGRYPFGRDDRERAVLAAIRDLRATGCTWAEVAAELNSRGPDFAPRSVPRWRPRNVAKVAA